MEHIRGEDLFKIMNKPEVLTYFRFKFVRAYRRMILDGVEYMHSKHICHMDLKLDNTMLTPNGTLKLVDFGLSSHFAEGATLHGVKGSPHY